MKEEEGRQNNFAEGSMGKNIIRMAVPMMLASLVNVLYSIVDRMYIGHIPGEGSLALTGLGLTMPVISIITAFSALCGTGGAPLCSIARGRGDTEGAEKIMGNAFTLLIGLGAVLTVLPLLFLKPLLFLFGASEATAPYAQQYAGIYICGTEFVMIALGMNYYINAQGFAKIGMLTVTLGAVINIVLDPILIFACNMGIAGAALATVFSQFCSALWALLFLTGKKALLRLKAKNLRLERGTVKQILALGVTGFVMNVTNGLMQIAYNAQLQRYGGDLYVGAMTVVNSVREFFFMVSHGITNGSQPVLGYNYGARMYSRVRQGIRFTAVAGVIYAVMAWALIMLFPAPLIRIFNSDPELLAVGVPSMRTFFCAFAFMALMATGQSVFVGLGMPKRAVFFSTLRKVVLVIPLVYLLPGLTGLGARGVFWAEPVSDVIGGVACFTTMYLTVYRPMGKLADGAEEQRK